MLRRIPKKDPDELPEVSEIFKTLSDLTRLRLLHALAVAGEACVHALCDRLDMSQPAVSHQLRILRVARLVRPRRVGREIHYSIMDEHVMELVKAARAHAMERR